MPAARLSLQLRASLTLALALLLVHGAAIACAALYLPGWWARTVAVAALIASLTFHLRRSALLLSGSAVTAVTLTEPSQCALVCRNAQTFTGSVEPSTFVTPLLIVINVRDAARNARRSAVLLADSAPAQDLRALRVWLRHRTGGTAPGSGPL